MYNAENTTPYELQSTIQLVRSTIIAIVVAIITLVTIVLPSEYGIDPTGFGRVTGLAAMGRIKQELSEEAKSDHSSSLMPDQAPDIFDRILGIFVGIAHAQEKTKWMDEFSFNLKPGETNELKLTMKKDEVAYYHLIVEGGRVNFDIHAHTGGEAVTYEKGRGSKGSEGEIVAAFDGNHGWFWRNRDKTPLTVTLKLRGAYSAIK
jgi:hypothetical protein